MTVVQNPSNIFTNFNSSNTANGTRTNNWQNTTKPNNLQRTPKKDEFQKGNSDSNKKQKNILIGAGVALVAAAGLLFGHKLYKSNQIANALEKIEQKFVTLQDNMPEVQKTFKEVFLRGDISEKEAREMLNRYKEIEKLGVTGTKEEYIQALFEEAKRNFGFENSNINLKIVSAGPNYGGGSGAYLSKIEINKDTKFDLLGTIHHEFRHKKQRYLESNYSFEDLTRAEARKAYNTTTNPEEKKKTFEQFLKENWYNNDYVESVKEDLLKMFNIKEFDSKRVPDELKEYVKKCIKANETYMDGREALESGQFGKYYDNFLEEDARFAEGSIVKLFGLMAK